MLPRRHYWYPFSLCPGCVFPTKSHDTGISFAVNMECIILGLLVFIYFAPFFVLAALRPAGKCTTLTKPQWGYGSSSWRVAPLNTRITYATSSSYSPKLTPRNPTIDVVIGRYGVADFSKYSSLLCVLLSSWIPNTMPISF